MQSDANSADADQTVLQVCHGLQFTWKLLKPLKTEMASSSS